MTLSLTKESDFKNVVYVENESSEVIAVEVTMAKREMDKFGKEKHPSASSLFKIYPSQLFLKPKEKRSLRLQWLGEKEIKDEQSFRLIAEQLPINVNAKKKQGIKLLLRYIAAVYVSPSSEKRNLAIKIKEQKGRSLTLEITNKGNVHQVLHDLKATLTLNSKKKIILEKLQLPNFAGENILQGKTRLFKIKLPSSELVKKVDLDFEQ